MEEKELITKTTEVKQAELAAVLGLSGRRVAQLCEDGIISKSARGRYCLAKCVQAYIMYKTEEESELEDLEIEREKRRAEVELKRARAKKAKLETAEIEGNMHRSEDVAAMTTDLIYCIRSALLAMPGRVAVDVAAVSNPAEVTAILKKENYAIMTDLSQYRYDPKKYEERVRDRLRWQAVMGEEDE